MHRPLKKLGLFASILPVLSFGVTTSSSQEGELLKLKPGMLVNESGFGDALTLIDEQEFTGPFISNRPESVFSLSPQFRDKFPAQFYLDFGSVKHLSSLAIYDLNGQGNIIFSIGEPGNWTPVLTEDGVGFKTWKVHELLQSTRYLRITKESADGVFGELLLWEQTPSQHEQLLQKARLLEEAAVEKANRPTIDLGQPFGKLKLIEEISPEATLDEQQFRQSASNATEIQQILGRPLRVLEPGNTAAYFAYRIGQFKLLEAGKPYLLTVEFADDVPRSFGIANRGGEISQGIFTGSAVGDVYFTYTNNNLESLQIPQSGEIKEYRQIFYLSDRSAGIEVPRGGGERPNEPENGFWVIFNVPNSQNMLGSAGAAIGKVRLFEIDDIEQMMPTRVELPEGLPKRHIFAREEMGDGVINSVSAIERAYDDPVEMYRHKATIYRFLGINTVCKDLLEFGSTQGWDTVNGDWYTPHKFPQLWSGIIDVSTEQGLDLMPYYEYAGSKGKLGLGMEQRAEPLRGPGDYTHVQWTEMTRADLTDPDTLEDFKKVLELTIIRHKDRGNFLGAWLRPRVSQLAIGFADATRQRFGQEANNGKTPTRLELQEDAQLLNRYYDWWYGKRKEFLTSIRDYLRQNGINDAKVLYTTVTGETGPSIWEPGWGAASAFVTDQPDHWKSQLTGEAYEKFRVLPYDQVAHDGTQGKMAQAFPKTWGEWEWNHGAPPADPSRYKDSEGIFMTYPFNRLYTVAMGSGISEFESDGQLAAVRFYPLNENTRDKLLGYFVADYERVGNYGLLEEANLVAHSNPTYLGFLSGYNLNTGFPMEVRRFNQNFLALPALPSELLSSASSNEAVVVRQIESPNDGVWFAVVNTGWEPVTVELNLPTSGPLLNAVTGEAVDGAQGGQVRLDLDPAELRSFRVK